MALKLVTAPANYPVSLEEAKAHLAVQHSEHDTLIEAYLAAAVEFVDGPTGFLGRALIDQTWDLYLDCFPCHQIQIPLPPLIEVLGVFYLPTTGVEQEFSAASYVVDDASQPGRVVLTATASWPTAKRDANAVRVRFRAGYIDTAVSPAEDNVPFSIKAAILLHIGDLYRNRENTVVGATVEKLPWASEQLLRPHRAYLGLA